jgi:hypothetical protein
MQAHCGEEHFVSVEARTCDQTVQNGPLVLLSPLNDRILRQIAQIPEAEHHTATTKKP